MNSPIVRNFDFFRIQHAKECVDIAPATLRLWSKVDGGPKLYQMSGTKGRTGKQAKLTWARFSEVEAFILANSETKQAA